MATANASSKGKTLSAHLGNIEGKELRENAQYCSLCDSDAEYCCTTCNSYLCNDCRGSHQRQRATKTHDVVHISNAAASGQTQYVFCQVHQGGAVQNYCEKCQVGVCAACRQGDHRSHTLHSLSNAKEDIKSMCLDKVKLLQIPLDKMKNKRKLLESRITGTADHGEIELELKSRKERLISQINDTFTTELKKIQSANLLVKANTKTLSSDLDEEIIACQSLLTPIMSVVLKDDVFEILQCAQNIDHEIKKARDILTKADQYGHLRYAFADSNDTQLHSQISTYLTLKEIRVPDFKTKSTQINKQITGLKLINKSQMNSYYYFTSRIFPDNFYVQQEIDEYILQMSYTTNATVHKLAKRISGIGKNSHGRSVLTINPTKHVVITATHLNLHANENVLKSIPHTPDGYMPDNIAYVSEQEFVTLCSKLNKIRLHCATSLDVLGTYDVKVKIQSDYVFLTKENEVIFYSLDDKQKKLYSFSRDGNMRREIPVHNDFFNFRIGTVSLINGQIICLQHDNSAHSFTLDGHHSNLGYISDDAKYVWGSSVDDRNLYVSCTNKDGSHWMNKYQIIYE